MTTKLLAALLAALLTAAPVATAQDSGDEGQNEDAKEGNNARDDAEARAEDPRDNRGSDDDDDDDDDDNDDGKGRGKSKDRDTVRRAVNIAADQDTVRIHLERETGATEDELKVTFDARDATFRTKYEAETGAAETEQKLDVELHQLLEYRDANGNDKFDAGETIVSAWNLGRSHDGRLTQDATGSASWQPLAVQDATSKDGAAGKLITARATLGPDGTGVFGFDMYAFGAFADVGDVKVGPAEVKFDILIQDYPFLADDTAVALVLTTKAKSESEFEDAHDDLERDEDGLAVTQDVAGEAVSLLFAWKDSAIVDGNETAVHQTKLASKMRTSTETSDGETETENKQQETVVLSYARGADVLHDPTLGISSASTGSFLSVPGFGVAFGAIAVVGAAAVVARRP